MHCAKMTGLLPYTFHPPVCSGTAAHSHAATDNTVAALAQFSSLSHFSERLHLQRQPQPLHRTPPLLTMAAAGGKVAYTAVETIPGLVAAARTTFQSGRTLSVKWRKQQLRAVLKLFAENEEAIVAALAEDLRRPK